MALMNQFLKLSSIMARHGGIGLSLCIVRILNMAGVTTYTIGKRMESQVPIELTEGDMLKLGTSTRIYRLQWILLSSTFEIEKALIYMDALPEEEREDTD